MAELRNATADRWDFDKGFRIEGLGSCFPRGISFADVDTETEINGRFLVIEGKRTGERVAGGQLFANRQRVADGRTVLFVYGDPPFGVVALQHFIHEPNAGILAASLADLHEACQSWATWAGMQPRLLPRPSDFVPPFALARAAA